MYLKKDFLLSFSLLRASFSLALRHNDYIAPSVKTENCIPIEEKYSYLILDNYLFCLILQDRSILFQTEIDITDEEEQDACDEETQGAVEGIVEHNVEEQQLDDADHGKHQSVETQALVTEAEACHDERYGQYDAGQRNEIGNRRESPQNDAQGPGELQSIVKAYPLFGQIQKYYNK